MELLINGRDEPRVVFNSRDTVMLKDAMNLKDVEPFHIAPVPTSEFFKDRSGCSTLRTHDGVTVDALEDVACEFNFLQPQDVRLIYLVIRSSSSSDFTTDLWPLLSMTKLSPCFSDILFPGQYYYESSGWSGKFMHPNNIPWDDKESQLCE